MSELWQGVTFCTPEYAEAAERWAARVRDLGGEPVVAGDKEFREARSIWYRAPGLVGATCSPTHSSTCSPSPAPGSSGLPMVCQSVISVRGNRRPATP
jgi:hypothetical protein